MKSRSKTRMIVVLIFALTFSLLSFAMLRANYLEAKELGEKYIQTFFTNINIRYIFMAVNFVILFFFILFSNIGIKNGLKKFFIEEKKEIPRLPNKSLAFVIAAITSVIATNMFLGNLILFFSNASFGTTDFIFNKDISYYMFTRPTIQLAINYLTTIFIAQIIYTVLYYIIVLNKYFDGVNRETIRNSQLINVILRNAKVLAILLGVATLLNTQGIVFSKFLVLDNTQKTEIVGAGFVEATIKLWGYRIYAVIIVASVWFAIRSFKKSNFKGILKSLAVIPSYLVVLFIVMTATDLLYVKPNELDKEKTYINQNINSTKNAYNINAEEYNLDYSGTLTVEEKEKYSNALENIPVVTQDIVLTSLEDTQTSTGYYTYRNAAIAKYDINGKSELCYVSPREIASESTTYDNKTYEYTHGYGEILVAASKTTDQGNVKYIQKGTDGQDNVLGIKEPRIYFGLETNDIIATNTKNRSEYDYTDASGKEHTYTYDGEAGLQLNFIDRLFLGIKNGDLKLAFSTSVSSDTKILLNRNIRERAKKALPYLLYDEKPYTVVDKNGDMYWVLDGYTTSSQYPYSTYTNIEYEGAKWEINYIRNSVKVLINAYDGTMKFYITDRTDPIAMAYRNVYPSLFEDIDSSIPVDISNQFVYPQYLYNIQSKMLEVYHNVKTDVLYRCNDIWEPVSYITAQTTKLIKTSTNEMGSYYTMLKTKNSDAEELGLVKMYSLSGRTNISSYLVGTTYGGSNYLSLYKFSSDTNLLGPNQLDKQIEQDETIKSELDALNVTGTKITKKMVIVPIDNTVIYVESVYQTLLNESVVPQLKKVIVASGSKLAIGNNLGEAIINLLSQEAVDLEITNTEDVDGLIDAIIKANNNLTESNKNNDWEMMGSDVKELQSLIDSLNQMVKENENKTNTTTDESNNTVENTNVVNQTN